MTVITTTQFRDRFSEFAAILDPRISELITEAYHLTDVSADATMYCTAHLAALESERSGGLDGGSGEVRSEAIGPKRVEYATLARNNNAGRDAFFSTTTYGRRVLTLESRVPRGVVSVRGG